MRVVATAGHVDHGKSTLVLALTGTDPDRFPAEKARGLTIDLGFAFTTLPSGRTVGFVDVPGHVRFAKNMLAGVGAVDVAMLVVAADEGWMPQTEEHAQVLELLGVQHGLIALTKADRLDHDGRELAELELAEHLGASVIGTWPVLAVDSVGGAGIDELRRVLDDIIAAAPPPLDAGRPRLWIDRAFSARGAGTVVTGTLAGGALAVDDAVIVEPAGVRARVRGIESNHERLPRAEPGSRVALNLAGIGHAQLQRGDAVVLPGQWARVDVVDVALHPLPGVEIPRRASLHAHVGSDEEHARVRLLDADGTLARMRLARPLPLAPGDRMILRSSGRQATVAGAEVVDVAPARRTSDALARLPRPLGVRVLDAREWLRPEELIPLAGVDRAGAGAMGAALVDAGDAVALDQWLVAPATLASLRRRAVDTVRAKHRREPMGTGVELATLAGALRVDAGQLRAALASEGTLVIDRDVVRDAERGAVVAEDPAARALLAALDATPFAPPAPGSIGAAPALVRALVRAGLVVDLDGVVVTASALAAARRLLLDALAQKGALTVGDARDVLASTRKYVLPILNRMDAEGVTRRDGDTRTAGPNASERPA